MAKLSSLKPVIEWGAALVTLLALGAQCARGQQPGILTAEERTRLEGEVKRLWDQAHALEREGKYTEAVEAGERGIAAERKLLGNGHEEIANSLGWLSGLYEWLENFPAARRTRAEEIENKLRRLGKDHWRVREAQAWLANIDLMARLTTKQRAALRESGELLFKATKLNQEGQFAEGMALAEKALALQISVLGNEHLFVSNAAARLGDQCHLAGDYARAEPLFLQAAETDKKLLGDQNPRYASDLEYLARLYTFKGEYPRAEPLYLRALEIKRSALGATHGACAVILDSLANLYTKNGETDRAEPLYQQALAIKKQAFGENHPEYSRSLNNLALLYCQSGRLAKAESLYLHALAIQKKTNGEGHPEYAAVLDNLGLLYFRLGDYRKAETHYRHATEIRKKSLGESHPDYALGLNGLAELFISLGDYARAEPLYLKAVEIWKGALGEGHPTYATGLNNLANMYQSKGDLGRAEPLCRQGLEIRKKALGERHFDFAGSLNNLAVLYAEMKDYARAEVLHQQALEIRKNVLGEAHPDYAQSLSNLALLYKRMNDPARAAPLFQRSLEIKRQALGAEHPDCAVALTSLAVMSSDSGDYGQAEEYYRQALAIDGKVLGEGHPEYATILNNLALMYFSQGKFAQGRPYFDRAMEIRKKSLGKTHSDYAASVNTLGELHEIAGEYTKAAMHYQESLAISRQNLERVALVQSERQQLATLRGMRHRLDNLIGLTAKSGNFRTEWYDEVLAWKGLVLGRQREMRLALAERPELAPVLAELRSVASKLATLSFATPKPEQAVAWQTQISDLSRQKERLEAELASRSAAFREAQGEQKVAEIQAALGAGTALIDLLEFAQATRNARFPGSVSWERRLGAFVLRSEGEVRFVDLGASTIIFDAIEAWRKGYGVSPEALRAGETLRANLWLPVAKYLDGASTVLICPDQDAAKIPFAALPGSVAGSYLLQERAVAVIPTPQAVVWLRRDRAGAQQEAEGLLVVGGIDYDRKVLRHGARQPKLAPRGLAPRGQRGERSGFSPLPGAHHEMTAVAELYRATHPRASTTTLEGADAGQEAIADAAEKHRYLHLATHGYFAAEQFKSAMERNLSATRPSEADFVTQQSISGYFPALLSGLALAGANEPTDDDDGILTAAEVEGLNLASVELVALSACESGLGKAAGGEGLLGLQRAFQVAGARTVVASLWSVPDEATRVLMVRFYENLWKKKLAKAEALREAQLWMLRQGAEVEGIRREVAGRGLVPVNEPGVQPTRLPPYFWAAFVLSGDWK